MKIITDTKLEDLTKAVGLAQEDLDKIQSTKQRRLRDQLNPVYWLGQLIVFLVSLSYSLILGIRKTRATYPFEHQHLAFLFAPFALSPHIINGFYSIKEGKQAGLSKRLRLLVFVANFSLFVLVFYLYYLSIPSVVYENGTAPGYGVYDTENSRYIFIDLSIQKITIHNNISSVRGL